MYRLPTIIITKMNLRFCPSTIESCKDLKKVTQSYLIMKELIIELNLNDCCGCTPSNTILFIRLVSNERTLQ